MRKSFYWLIALAMTCFLLPSCEKDSEGSEMGGGGNGNEEEYEVDSTQSFYCQTINGIGYGLSEYNLAHGINEVLVQYYYPFTMPADVVIPEEVEYAGMTFTPVGVMIGAFSGCEKLSSISLPSTIKTLGDCAFSGCDHLSSVYLEEGLDSIGWGCFEKCLTLVTLEIPHSVTRLDPYAFINCPCLSLLRLPRELQDVQLVLTEDMKDIEVMYY